MSALLVRARWARLRAGFLISALLVAFAVAMPGPSAAQTAKTAAAGIYNEAQALRGKKLYQDSCAACHGASLEGAESLPLSGKHFAARWGTLPVGALLTYLNMLMPLGQPGSLGVRGNTDVVAYILSVNKFPAGAAELPADQQVLDEIIINSQ